MENLIVRLLDKIDSLEREIQHLKRHNVNQFLNSMDIANLYYKGIKASEMYDLYIKEARK